MDETRAKAVGTRLLETDRVIVTEWRFAPGAHTGWHRHAYDYIVVPMTSGALGLRAAEGRSRAELTAGRPYARGAGVEHDVINENDFEFVFIEIELK